MRVRKMKHFFAAVVLVVFVAAVSLFCTGNVDAQDARGVVITPKRIVFERGDRILEVLLANRGDKEEKFRIELINKAMQENGQLVLTDTPAPGEHFASDVVRYSPRQIVLGPRETQKVRLMSRLKADSPDGEYRSHLLIQEIPPADDAAAANKSAPSKGIGVNVRAIFGITIPVILRKGALEASAKLSDPKIITFHDEPYVQVAIEREGTKSLFGTANVYAGDQKIATLKNIAVYLSTPRRVVQIKVGSEFAKSISGKPLRVTFGPEAGNEDAPETEITFTPQ